MLVPAVRKLLPHLPERAGFWLTRKVAGLVRSPKPRPGDRAFLAEMEPLRYGGARNKWALLHGHGPLVMLVHGWAGSSAQMLAMARHLVGAGFRVVVPDITAHGRSSGLQVSFRDFVDDIAACCEVLGQVPHVMVGHSAGGLAMAAARRMRSIQAQRYVFLCAPRGPYIPIDEIRRHLNPPQGVLARCRAYYASQLDAEWEALDAGSAFHCADGTPAMLVYDRDDPRLRKEDSHIIERQWAGARSVLSSGLGHIKPLWEPRIIGMVADFLSASDCAPRKLSQVESAAAIAASPLPAAWQARR
jgi:pimeloyl-ACP methyl ester carboxylesterase